MGLFEYGADAAEAQKLKHKIKMLQAQMNGASAEKKEELKAEIAQLQMILAASNQSG